MVNGGSSVSKSTYLINNNRHEVETFVASVKRSQIQFLDTFVLTFGLCPWLSAAVGVLLPEIERLDLICTEHAQ